MVFGWSVFVFIVLFVEDKDGDEESDSDEGGYDGEDYNNGKVTVGAVSVDVPILPQVLADLVKKTFRVVETNDQ